MGMLRRKYEMKNYGRCKSKPRPAFQGNYETGNTWRLLFSYIFIVWKLVTTKPICFLQQLSNVTNNVNDGVEVALWLLVTYIGGFVINSMASFLERNVCYRLFNRPSKKVLTFGGKDEIEGADNVIKDSKVRLSFRSITNDESRCVLRFVKNNIVRKDNLVEEMYHQSIMARNLCMSHFLAMFISYFFVPDLLASSTYVIVSIFLLLIFWKEWRRKNLVYVRNIFTEYLQEKSDKAK